MIIISENRLLERMKRLKEQAIYKDRLLATVSHDLRTPLNGIIGMILLALDEISDRLVKKTLGLALRSSKLLLYMINDILDFSQISSGKLRLIFETFDLWDTIKDVSKLIKFQAKQKGIEFLAENKTGSDKIKITNDQNRLKQVLLNLLGNALKFTERGRIKITLESLNNSSEQEYRISVEDTGIGIKKEDIPKLFKLFGKLDNCSEENLNKTGVGLGLAISQSLVRILNKNNGEIKVLSNYGKGSCFYFPLIARDPKENSSENFNNLSFLELEEANLEEDFIEKLRIVSRNVVPAKGNEINELVIEETKTRAKTRILVVDDDQINIKVASSYLKKSPEYYEFDVAFDGTDAIEILKRKALEDYFFDVIIMDCNMPKMDGFEATGIIRKMIEDGALRSVEIIACTANASENDYQQCFRSGMTDFISKPFSREELFCKIQKALKKRK